MVMPFCYDGINDMFEPHPWNLQEVAKVRKKANMRFWRPKVGEGASYIIIVQDCLAKWGVVPQARDGPKVRGRILYYYYYCLGLPG